MIRFFDTLSGKLKDFDVAQAGMVKMYTCGPTVYDYAHIGNFRTYVFEDLLRRFLEFRKFKVQHVMNVTDIDDKTIAGANRARKVLGEFTSRYLEAFNEDLKTLNILPPHKQPHATEEIPAMIELIGKLVESGKAYASDGSVYYRVSAFPAYGKLSKKDLKCNIRGARVDQDEYEKEEGADFALWKKAKEGEPAWDSPWGKGRPGWHIECSAMSMKYLGETFDIHAGGEDLIFPHHENEIAQSEGATGKPFVRYWLHAKHLLVNGEKMSKSKGNFYTLRDLIAKDFHPMDVRYVLLSVHYRQQLNFTLEGIEAAKEALKRIRDFWYDRSMAAKDERRQKKSGELLGLVRNARQQFIAALEDDLNVPKAFGALFELIKEGNQLKKESIGLLDDQEADRFFNEVDSIIGIFSRRFFVQEIPNQILEIMKERETARTKKDYARADQLRNQIQDFGFILEDTHEGSKVKKFL